MAATPKQGSTENPPVLNLRQKLVAAMLDMEAIEKRGENRAQNYKYIMAADIILAARKTLAKHGIAFHATQESIEDLDDYTTKSGAIMSTCRVHMKFTLLDTESDEKLEILSTGEGQDSGDKAIYKGKTGALKYALTQTLMMAEGADDPENDRGEEARTGYSRPAGQAQKPSQPPLRTVRDRICPNCGKGANVFIRKRDGTWACWGSKGGCEAGPYTDADLDAMSEDTTGSPENHRDSDIKNPKPPPPDKPEDTGRFEERIVATDEMLAPLVELISKASDPAATQAAICARCGVSALSDLNQKQVEWQIGNLQQKLDMRATQPKQQRR